MLARLSGLFAHPFAKGFLARLSSLIPTAVATLLASRLILDRYGVEVFNTYTLAWSTILLIPLNGLGAGAALTSAVAADGATAPGTMRIALTAARTLAVSGVALVVVSLALSALDGWGWILGEGAYDTPAFGLSLALYGLAFIPALGQSALLGANKNHVNILVMTFQAPVMCLGAAIAIALDLAPFWVVVVPGAAVLLVSIANAIVCARMTGLRLIPLLPKVPWPRRHPGARIREVAWPALLLTITAPLMLQSQRLVLSHVASASDVARYSVGAQVFAPLRSLIPAVASPLWPMFTRARITGEDPPDLWKIIRFFVVLTGGASVILALLANPIAEVIGEGEVNLGFALPVAGVLALVFQAITVPLGMALMYPKALRLMSGLALLALPINIGLSIVAGELWGAPGPLYAGLLVAIVIQTIPAAIHFQRHGLQRSNEPMSLTEATLQSEVLTGAAEVASVAGGFGVAPVGEDLFVEAVDGPPDEGGRRAPRSHGPDDPEGRGPST